MTQREPEYLMCARLQHSRYVSLNDSPHVTVIGGNTVFLKLIYQIRSGVGRALITDIPSGELADPG